MRLAFDHVELFDHAFSVFPEIPPTFQNEYKEAQVKRALVLEKVLIFVVKQSI